MIHVNQIKDIQKAGLAEYVVDVMAIISGENGICCCGKPIADDDVFCEICADFIEYCDLLFTGTDEQLEQKAKEINQRLYNR